MGRQSLPISLSVFVVVSHQRDHATVGGLELDGVLRQLVGHVRVGLALILMPIVAVAVVEASGRLGADELALVLDFVLVPGVDPDFIKAVAVAGAGFVILIHRERAPAVTLPGHDAEEHAPLELAGFREGASLRRDHQITFFGASEVTAAIRPL